MDLRGKNIEGGYFNLVTVEGDSNATSGKLQDGQGTDLGNIAIGGLSFNSATSEFSFPAGTTAQRPSTPSAGYARYNTDTGKLEIYSGNAWLGIVPEGLVELGVATATVSAQDAEAIITFFSDFGTPEAGYSVRQLGSNSLAMRVRRSSDNAETNIGFTASGDLDESALTTFTGANDGFVTTWYNQAVDTETLPADFGSGATASYSLRKVESDYTGDAIRVRRSSDNQEQDIGFVDGELDTSSLETFCGAGDGFVTTWYDQSGINNATQSTAGSQPQIVSSGTTITENGKPAIDFDGSDDSLVSQSVPSMNQYPFSIFGVYDVNSNDSLDAVFGTNNYDGGFIENEFGIASRQFDIFVEIADSTAKNAIRTASTFPDFSQKSAIASSSTLSIFNNGVNVGSTSITISQALADNKIHIGVDAGGQSLFTDMEASEFILYADDQSSNREAIEANQASFYDIGISGSHAVQGTAGSQPKIVSSGSVIKENSQPALDFDGSDDGLGFDSSGFDIGNLSSFAVGKYNTLENTMLLSVSGPTGDKRWYAPFADSTDFRFGYADNSTALSVAGDNNTHLFTMIAGSTLGNMQGFVDDSSLGTVTLSTGIDPFGFIGEADGGFHADCNVQEVIIYASDQSANRQEINSNIADYFNITI